MTYAALGHNWDAYCILYCFYYLWIAHTGYATGGTNVGRHTFKSHNSHCTGRLGNTGLFR